MRRQHFIQGSMVAICLLTAPVQACQGYAQEPRSEGVNPSGTAAPVLAPGTVQVESDRDGSTDVPMDSWMYPVLERLGALGFIPDQNLAIRPWTRQECRRQAREATGLLQQGIAAQVEDPVSDRHRRSRFAQLEAAEDLLSGLDRMLSEPAGSHVAVLESTYVRVGTIAGPALTDSFHLGQTWRNDLGRPFARGTSSLTGYSARVIFGRSFLYARQELQNSSISPAVTPALHALYNELDNVHYGSSAPDFYPVMAASAASLRPRTLELYAGLAFAGASLSFGKQELFWGPTSAPLAFSSNAEPTYNLRLVATRPHPLPVFPGLGSYRFNLVFGKLSGHRYPARPYFNGQKISFNFGSALELSFTRWSLLFGVGHPMTLHALKSNLFSSSSTGTTFTYGERTDPGDRKSGFDFRLRIPGLHGLLTVYADSFADDEPNPLDAPRRVVWAPGLYLARLPFLPKADLKVEVVSSEELSEDEGGLRAFINNQYRDANLNNGFLLGNAVGRDGRSVEARLGYWFSNRTRVEAAIRQTKQSSVYLAGGGTVSDAFASTSVALSPNWAAGIFTQYERFFIPVYLPQSRSNGSVRLQVEWNAKLPLLRPGKR